jgi:hypothetical protein
MAEDSRNVTYHFWTNNEGLSAEWYDPFEALEKFPWYGGGNELEFHRDYTESIKVPWDSDTVSSMLCFCHIQNKFWVI